MKESSKINFQWARPGPKTKARWEKLKAYSGKIFGKAFEDFLVKGLVVVFVFVVGYMASPFLREEDKQAETFIIEGLVQDEDSNPVAGAEVFVEKIEGVALTKADGTFSLEVEHIDDGEMLLVQCSKEGYLTEKNSQGFPQDNAPVNADNIKTLYVTFELKALKNSSPTN